MTTRPVTTTRDYIDMFSSNSKQKFFTLKQYTPPHYTPLQGTLYRARGTTQWVAHLILRMFAVFTHFFNPCRIYH